MILITPETVCENDGFVTTVHLDGRMSSRHLSLVPLPPEDSAFPDGAVVAPLTYAWQLDGDDHHVTRGTLTDSTLDVQVAGARPLHVTLTTTNVAGGSAASLRTLPITLRSHWTFCRDDSHCPGGACDLATNVCVGTTHCTSDAGCDTCFVCDAATSTCVPRPS